MTSHPRPCIECGTLSASTRCVICQREREAKRPRSHYAGSYSRRAREVREGAVVCWVCGEGAKDSDPWQADHIYPGEPDSPLLPAHRSCNIRRTHTPPRS